MGNKNVLLVGTSFSAVPLLQYLKGLGYSVSVCGGFKNDPCHHYADTSYYIDYSDKAELLKLCEREDFDYIVPSCNDYAYNSASYVATNLNKFYGFDAIDITNILHTKNKFRAFTITKNLSVPKALRYTQDTDLQTLSYPLLVKPDDGFSGKGVAKVDRKLELQEAINNAKKVSSNHEVVIEEFVEGDLYSHSAFIQNGTILIDFFVDEFCTVYPYQVDSSCLSYNLNNNIKESIKDEIQALVSSLNLSDGLLHTQFISDNRNFWLIETMRRCPGDLYGTLIEKSTGFNYTAFYCRPFLNQKNNIDKLKIRNSYIARHTISTSRKLIFKSWKSKLKPNKLNIYPLKESGHELKEAPFDKLSLVFYEFGSQKELIENTKKMKDFFTIDTYEGIINE